MSLPHLPNQQWFPRNRSVWPSFARSLKRYCTDIGPSRPLANDRLSGACLFTILDLVAAFESGTKVLALCTTMAVAGLGLVNHIARGKFSKLV